MNNQNVGIWFSTILTSSDIIFPMLGLILFWNHQAQTKKTIRFWSIFEWRNFEINPQIFQKNPRTPRESVEMKERKTQPPLISAILDKSRFLPKKNEKTKNSDSRGARGIFRIFELPWFSGLARTRVGFCCRVRNLGVDFEISSFKNDEFFSLCDFFFSWFFCEIPVLAIFYLCDFCFCCR